MDDYVEEVEYRAVGIGAVTPEEADWLVLHCVAGDMYQAFAEDGAWWLLFIPGEPSEGPFATDQDVVDWLNAD